MAHGKRVLVGVACFLLAGAGIRLVWRGGAAQAPEGASPAPKASAPEPRNRDRAAPPPAPISRPEPPVEGMLREYLRMTLLQASALELDQAEHGIERALQEVSASRRLQLLLGMSAPSARAVILRSVDDGLLRDRPSEEAAMEAALERAGKDEARAAEIAALALLRVRDKDRRDRMAAKLAGPDTPERLLPWAARLATGEKRLRMLREMFWARVPAEGAVEALGWVVEPEEATRLESLGRGVPRLRGALERAYQRTGDPAFQESLSRLGS